jgi:hypothetical protein
MRKSLVFLAAITFSLLSPLGRHCMHTPATCDDLFCSHHGSDRCIPTCRAAQFCPFNYHPCYRSSNCTRARGRSKCIENYFNDSTSARYWIPILLAEGSRWDADRRLSPLRRAVPITRPWLVANASSKQRRRKAALRWFSSTGLACRIYILYRLRRSLVTKRSTASG